uniref:Enamelin n=1 Tax=Nothobranchius rachovii TaxID=451742 RepID=A0A1A8NAG1_9TELE
MKRFGLLMCLLVPALAAPVPDSESGEQVAAHANEALRLMELYRLFQQQGVGGNPFLPAPADAPADPAAAAVVNLQAAPVRAEDASDEEAEDGNVSPKAAAPAAPTAPLNSDEAEEAEEEETAEAEPAVVEAAPAEPTADPAAEPGASLEPAVVDIPVEVAPVDGAAVDVPPVDIVPVDTPAPGVAVAADAGADPLAADAGLTAVADAAVL